MQEMKEGVTLLAISDIHGKVGAVKEFVTSIDVSDVRAVDAVVIAGDVADPQNPGTFHRVVAEIAKIGKPVFYVRGNWDVNAPAGVVNEDPLVADLEGLGPVELNGATLVGHAASLEPVRRSLKKPVVLVTHYPPFSILDRGRRLEAAQQGSHTGLPEVNYLVSHYKPVAHVFGHCHALGGLDVKRGGTVFVNVARLDRVSRDGRVTGNYAFISIDRSGSVNVRWRFVNGYFKKCSKCGKSVHLPFDWTLCRKCASRHELSFRRLDRSLERVMVSIIELPSNINVLKEEFFIPISTLKDEEAFEDLIEYLIFNKLKDMLLKDGSKVLALSKDKVIEYYSEVHGSPRAFSEYLFACKEEQVGKRICALMKLFHADKRTRVLWKIRSIGQTIVEREIVLAREDTIRSSNLLEELRGNGFDVLIYRLEKLSVAGES